MKSKLSKIIMWTAHLKLGWFLICFLALAVRPVTAADGTFDNLTVNQNESVSGSLGIGTLDTTVRLNLMDQRYDANVGSTYGMTVRAYWSPTNIDNSFSHYGGYFGAFAVGGTNVNGFLGLRGVVGVGGISGAYGTYYGTVAEAVGVYGAAQNWQGGTLQQGFALYSGSPMGGSTINNQYGLWIDPQKVSGVGKAYGVYQAGTGDTNYFAGYVGIGTYAPTAALHVTGNIRADGQFIGNGAGLTGLSIPMTSVTGTLTADRVVGNNLSSAVLPTTGGWNAPGVVITNAALAVMPFGNS